MNLRRALRRVEDKAMRHAVGVRHGAAFFIELHGMRDEAGRRRLGANGCDRAARKLEGILRDVLNEGSDEEASSKR